MPAAESFGFVAPDMEVHNPGPVARLCLTQLTLQSFRNYGDVRLRCHDGSVVLVGANGSGKTNLIEAISLLVPGRGLRRAALDDLQQRQSTAPWAVAANLSGADGDIHLGTGRATALQGETPTTRVVHIDGKPARSQNALAEHIAMAWITPSMDSLLSDGAAARRKFLDRLVYSFDPAHGARVQRYEKAMRERLRLLREAYADPAWLDALEDEMAQTATAIAAARRHLIDELRHAIAASGYVFPRALLAVQGTAEDRLADHPALLVEDGLRDDFRQARSEDARSGTCAVGAHRSDLRVYHQSKSCPAELCSTGEQKALLIAIMLAYVRLLTDKRGFTPLFLLDDIVSHLDLTRRIALFDEIADLKTQAWLTGTDRQDFVGLADAQIIVVNDGNLTFGVD